VGGVLPRRWGRPGRLRSARPSIPSSKNRLRHLITVFKAIGSPLGRSQSSSCLGETGQVIEPTSPHRSTGDWHRLGCWQLGYRCRGRRLHRGIRLDDRFRFVTKDPTGMGPLRGPVVQRRSAKRANTRSQRPSRLAVVTSRSANDRVLRVAIHVMARVWHEETFGPQMCRLVLVRRCVPCGIVMLSAR